MKALDLAKLKEKLKSEILMVPYPDLEPHVERGSVVVVDESLDMLSVACSISQDDKAYVSSLILKKLLTKASPLDYQTWKREKRFFNSLIIQPFVVVQYHVALNNIDN